MFEECSSNYYLYVAAFTAHIGGFLSGTSMSWTSPVLAKLTSLDDNPLGRIITLSEQGLLGSTPLIGNLLGTFLSGYLANKFGRKPVLILMSFPIFIGYTLIAFSETIWLMYLGNAISGLTTAAVFTVEPMYFGEIAEKKNRGLLGASMNCFVNFGLLFSLSVGPFTSFFHFHMILIVFPILYIILLIVVIPESPHFLVKKDMKSATESLRKLRGVRDVKTELYEIKEYVENRTESSLLDILNNKGLRKALIIGSSLVFFQQFSGTSIVMTYGQLIFSEASDFIPSEFSPIIIVAIQNVFGFITPAITDRSGRKILLLISYIGITVSLSIFGVYFYLKSQEYEVESMRATPLISLIFFTLFYSLGAGPLPWTVIAELFPLEAKAIGATIISCVCWTSAFVVILCFNWVKVTVGMGPTFWIFAIFGIFAAIFVKFYMIETKKKSLEEIQDNLNS